MEGDRGWIKLHRSMLDWEWYQNSNTARLFIHCLLRANHKPKKWQGITIERGCFVSSLPMLASELKLSERAIRTALNHLKTTGEVTAKSTNKYTIYKVENYGLYQMDDRQDDRQATGKRQASDRQVTANKNDKNVRMKEEKNICDSPADATASRAPRSSPKSQKGAAEAAEVINFWNNRFGSNWRPGSKETIKAVNRLLADGHAVEEIKAVIDYRGQIKESEEDRKQWFIPSTVLRPCNFERFLQQMQNSQQAKQQISRWDEGGLIL